MIKKQILRGYVKKFIFYSFLCIIPLLLLSCHKKEQTDQIELSDNYPTRSEVSIEIIETKDNTIIEEPESDIAKEIALFFIDRNGGSPFTFFDDIGSPISEIPQELTTEYLLTFTGKYIFDSYEIINPGNVRFNPIEIINSTISIIYNEEKNCLTFIPRLNFSGEIYIDQLDIFELSTTKPFHWFFGEAAGFLEHMFFFYNDGIVFYYDLNLNFEHLGFIVFFKKAM